MDKKFQPTDPLLTTVEAANYLGLKPKTLPIWRCYALQGKKVPNIPYIKVGRLVKYRLSALDKYLETREVSTS